MANHTSGDMATHTPRSNLRTYSKRVLKESSKPPSKRQRVEIIEEVVPIAIVKPDPAITDVQLRKPQIDYLISLVPQSAIPISLSQEICAKRFFEQSSRPPSRRQCFEGIKDNIFVATIKSDLTVANVHPPKSKIDHFFKPIPLLSSPSTTRTGTSPSSSIPAGDHTPPSSPPLTPTFLYKYRPSRPRRRVRIKLGSTGLDMASQPTEDNLEYPKEDFSSSSSRSSSLDLVCPPALPIPGARSQQQDVRPVPTGRPGSEPVTYTADAHLPPDERRRGSSMAANLDDRYQEKKKARKALAHKPGNSSNSTLSQKRPRVETPLLIQDSDSVNKDQKLQHNVSEHDLEREVVNKIAVPINSGRQSERRDWSNFSSSSCSSPSPSTQQTASSGKTSKLVQTTLDVGASPLVTCVQCKLQYNRSLTSDRVTHDEYHDNMINGIAVKGLRFDDTMLIHKIVYAIDQNGHEQYIVIVTKDSHASWKTLASQVLEKHVDKDLNSSTIAQDYLWSMIADPNNKPIMTSDAQDKEIKNHTGKSTIGNVNRFAVFLYIKAVGIQGRSVTPRVVGALLAERIGACYEIVKKQIEYDEFGEWPSMVPEFENARHYPDPPHEVYMGVNKIWTHSHHQHQRIASRMMDAARQNLIYGKTIRKTQIALTQPTSSGTMFAIRYIDYQGDFSWLEYDEDRYAHFF